jgi:hypothetical protein
MLISFAIPHSLASGMSIWEKLLLHLLSFAAFPIGAILGVKASKPKKRRKRK